MTQIYNRIERKLVQIPEYRSKIMVFLHTHKAGRFLMKYLLSLPFINTIITRKKYRAESKKEIAPFIEFFGLNPLDFEKKPEEFESFADFFVRKLKKESRPFPKDKSIFASPSDGVINIAPLAEDSFFKVKGTDFSLEQFLGNKEKAKKFIGGTVAIIYLAPYNYHRFHYPIDSNLEKKEILGNRLFSVSPISIHNGFRPFDFNYRHINYLKNQIIGDFVMAEVGAFYVGRIIETNSSLGENLSGDEKGYFGLGGSTIVLVFQKNSIKFDSDIIEMSSKNIPVSIIAGERIGICK